MDETYALRNPISGGFDTEHYTAILVLGALVGLWAIRRGFRGVGPVNL